MFYLSGIDFIGPFPLSEGKEYILVVCGLCVQMGRGDTDKDKQSSNG